jgi:hypothetical protein
MTATSHGSRGMRKTLLALAAAALAVGAAAAFPVPSQATASIEPETLARARAIRAEVNARYRLWPAGRRPPSSLAAKRSNWPSAPSWRHPRTSSSWHFPPQNQSGLSSSGTISSPRSACRQRSTSSLHAPRSSTSRFAISSIGLPGRASSFHSPSSRHRVVTLEAREAIVGAAIVIVEVLVTVGKPARTTHPSNQTSKRMAGGHVLVYPVSDGSSGADRLSTVPATPETHRSSPPARGAGRRRSTRCRLRSGRRRR